MNTNYKINTGFAISKALEAVKSWEVALATQTAARDLEGIEFCQKSLEGCRANLAKVRESTKQVHQWL